MMTRPARPALLGICLALIIGEGAAPAVAKTCRGRSLSAALLDAAERGGVQVVFAPGGLTGLCADGFAPSNRPQRDIEGLARRAGLDVRQVRPGLLTLTRPEPVPPPASLPRPPRLPTPPVTEVVVTGHVMAAPYGARSDGNASILSQITAADIARRPPGNVADALSALPGMSTYADMGLGQAATGSPEFATVRGFDASYNAYTLNGVGAPQSDPNSRALSLKMLPAFAAGAITVIKSPTAAYDGDGIGGLIDIRTPTAFDYPHALLQMTLGADQSDLARKTGFPASGGTISAEFARRFADERFGVYVGAYFGRSRSVAESGEVGSWVPTLQSQAGLDNYAGIARLSATEYKYDFYTNDIRTFGGNASLDYRAEGVQLYLKMLAAHYDDRGSDSQMSVRHGLANTGVNAAGQVVDFWGRPVGPGLPGAPAYAPQQVSRNASSAVGGTDYNAQGIYDPNGVFPGAYFQLRDQTNELYTVQAGGQNETGRFTLAYVGSYGFSRQARPDYLEASSYGAPLEDARVGIGWANNHIPQFKFSSPAAETYIFNQSNIALWKVQGLDSASDDARLSFKFSTDYRPELTFLPHVDAGFSISLSNRSQYQHNLFGNGDGNFTLVTAQGYATPYWAPAGASLNNQPGRDLQTPFFGFPGVFRVLSRNGLSASVAPYLYRDNYAIDPTTGQATWPNPGAYTINDYYGGSASSRENIYAGYLSADIVAGSLSIYPGLRYEQTTFAGRYWTIDTATTGHFASVNHAYAEWLPSLNLVWAPPGSFVYRAAFRRGFTRPPVSLLASPTIISTEGVVSVGNPSLAPTTALNYDFAVSYSGSDGTEIKLGAYAKTLSHFIYAASVTGSAPSADLNSVVENGITYERPENGRSAWLAGLEIEIHHRLMELPGPLSGLAASASATFQRSGSNSGRPDHFGRSTWLPRAPETICHIDLSWTAPHVRTDLMFHYTGLQLENLTNYNVDNFLQPTATLNWSATLYLKDLTIDLAMKNLTNQPDFWKTFGRSKRYLGVQDGGGNGSYVMTGRSASLRLAYQW